MSSRTGLAALLTVIALLTAGCGGGGGEDGDVAVCEASLDMDDALAANIPDEERLLRAMEAADQASVDAQDEVLVELAEEAGVLATTARVAVEDTGTFSDGLFDEMVLLADDLSAECGDLGL